MWSSPASSCDFDLTYSYLHTLTHSSNSRVPAMCKAQQLSIHPPTCPCLHPYIHPIMHCVKPWRSSGENYIQPRSLPSSIFQSKGRKITKAGEPPNRGRTHLTLTYTRTHALVCRYTTPSHMHTYSCEHVHALLHGHPYTHACTRVCTHTLTCAHTAFLGAWPLPTFGFWWVFSINLSVLLLPLSVSVAHDASSFCFSLFPTVSFPFALSSVSFSLFVFACLCFFIFLSSCYISFFLPCLPLQPEIALSP